MINVNLHAVYGICQKNCPHCCIIPGVARHGTHQMSVADIEQFIQLNRYDTHRIGLFFIPAGEALMNPNFFEIVDRLHQANFPLVYIATNLATRLTDENLKTLSKIQYIAVDFSDYEIPQSLLDLTFENYKRLKAIAPAQVQAKRVYHPNMGPAIVPETRTGSIIDVYSEGFMKWLIAPDYDFQAYLKRLGLPTLQDPAVRDWTTAPKLEHCSPFQVSVLTTGEVSLCVCQPLREDGTYIGNAFNTPLLEMLGTGRTRNIAQRIWNRDFTEGCKYCYGAGYEEGKDTELRDLLLSSSYMS